MSKKISLLLIILAIILFQVANLTYWARFKLLEQDNFVELSTQSLQEPEVRKALSQKIVKLLFSDRPLVRRKSQDIIEAAIGGILESPFTEKIVELTSRVIFKALTTDVSEGIRFNLEPIKTDIIAIAKALAPDRVSGENLATIPDQIVLLEPGEIPPLHKIRPLLFRATILCGLIALLLFGLVLFKSKDQNFSFRWIGFFLFFTSLIIYYLQIPLQNSFVSSLNTPIAKAFGNAFFVNFTRPFKWQLLFLLIFGLGLFAMGLVGYRQAFGFHSPKLQGKGCN